MTDKTAQVRETRRSTPSARSARTIPARTWHEDNVERLTRGERAADRMRNVMGSWPFVGGFVVFMALWALANAGLQGAILLIAAKRQDAIAAALARHDYETNIAAKTDIETLLEINRSQMQLIEELHALVRERLGA